MINIKSQKYLLGITLTEAGKVNVQMLKNTNMLTGAPDCVLNVLYRQQCTCIVFGKQKVNNV